MQFHQASPKEGVVCNDSPFSFYLLLNQSKRDNVGKTNVTFQLLHLITIGKIPIVYNKKAPWNKLVVITNPDFGL